MKPDDKIKILQAVKDKTLSTQEAIKALMQLEQAAEKPSMATIESGQSYVESLLQDLKNILLKILRLEESDLNVDTSIVDLGLDSITATAFASNINQKYQLNILPSVFFEFTSLRLFAKYLESNFAATIKEYYEKYDKAHVNKNQPEKDNDVTKAKANHNQDKLKRNIETLWAQAAQLAQKDLKNVKVDDDTNFKIISAKLALISRENQPDIEVAIIGYGRPILLLGGMLQPYQAWKHQVEALSDHYQLIMVNLPGCGRSGVPASLTLEVMMQSTLIVMDALSITKPLPVLGYSLGGILALHLCLNHPERISALMLACTTSDTTKLTNNLNKLMDEITDVKDAIGSKSNLELMSFYGEATKNFNVLSELNKIRIPTLVIAAENDYYMLPEYNEMIHQKIQGSAYKLISNAKHLAPFTHYQAFDSALIEFLKNNKLAMTDESESFEINIKKIPGISIQVQSAKELSAKFCIIGGGPVGMGIGKCLKQNGIAFDIIEREEDFGGLWGIDYTGGRVYSSTHLISSRRNTQFSDYPMPDNYPDYPNYKLVLKYFRNFAKHFDLYSHATFNTEVKSIKDIDQYWKVILTNGETRFYRGVIVATGRLSEPILPIYPGNFLGTTIHSSQYKNPDILKNKRVLIVGAGNSGCDIAVDAVHHASKTIQSMRRGYYFMPKYIFGKPTQDWLMEIGTEFNTTEELWNYVKGIFKMAGYAGEDFGLPKPDYEIYAAHPIMNSQILYHIGHGDLLVKPDVKYLKGNSVVFSDNTEEEVDLIIYASGYHALFPFLPKSYGINNQNDLHKLFMYTFHKQFNNLFFAGYINAPSGLGNLANGAGILFSNYIQALINQASVLQIFNHLVQGPEPDLGHEKYIKTERHGLEVDLWLLLRTMNFLATKLSPHK